MCHLKLCFLLENEDWSSAQFFFCSFSQELWCRLKCLFGLIPPSVRHCGSGWSCQMELARSRCRLGSRSHPVSFRGDCFPGVASVAWCLLFASFTNVRRLLQPGTPTVLSWFLRFILPWLISGPQTTWLGVCVWWVAYGGGATWFYGASWACRCWVMTLAEFIIPRGDAKYSFPGECGTNGILHSTWTFYLLGASLILKAPFAATCADILCICHRWLCSISKSFLVSGRGRMPEPERKSPTDWWTRKRIWSQKECQRRNCYNLNKIK